jgi:hypothetical protein
MTKVENTESGGFPKTSVFGKATLDLGCFASSKSLCNKDLG